MCTKTMKSEKPDVWMFNEQWSSDRIRHHLIRCQIFVNIEALKSHYGRFYIRKRKMSNKKSFVFVPFVVSAMQRAIKIPFRPDLESLLLSAQKQSPFKPLPVPTHTPRDAYNVHPGYTCCTHCCEIFFFHLCYTCPNAKSIMSLLKARVNKIDHF